MSPTTLPSTILTLRPAGPADAAAVARLAQLDSASIPTGALLIAIADDRLLAAISVETGAVIADPFTRTSDLVGMLRERAGRLAVAAQGGAPGASGTSRGLGRLRRMAT